MDKRLIFKAPARIVRVNKGALDGILRAKSRMVIPGHLDPRLGEYSILLRRQYGVPIGQGSEEGGVHSCTCGWTTSMPTAWKEGCGTGELLRVCKSAYGLSEAPRLWYLRATELLVEIGFKEIPMCKATYIWKKGDSLDVAAILCLHVDDGIPWTT